MLLSHAFLLLVTIPLADDAITHEPADCRNLASGSPIPDQGYCDQPYIVVTRDGNWLCTLTTGPGREGQGGQHVVATVSTDQGNTWSPLIDIEPSDGPEASWVVPLVTPTGRVYAFYSYNGDRVSTLPGSTGKIRADTIGWYCYRYSDDNGRTWSSTRYRLPVRQTACDLANNWKGSVQIFWGIDKPKIDDGRVYFSFTKLGKYMLEDGEGWLFTSRNVLQETDARKIEWKVLPDGQHGIRSAAFGSVQEEHNMVPLGNGRLYMVYRTTMGYPCHTYSLDRGHTWAKPVPMTDRPGGKQIKNPRACPKLWKCSNGKYLFWFHNHGGHSYKQRNPVWICGGTFKNGAMHWSQPEILLYDDDPKIGMSYPDLVEQDGQYWMTETQKSVARIHKIDSSLLDGLWSQETRRVVTNKGLLVTGSAGPVPLAKSIDLRRTGGISIECWVNLAGAVQPNTLVDNRNEAGCGFTLSATESGAVRMDVSDGASLATWESDAGALSTKGRHHIVAIVDNGPRIMSFVVDGRLCDGSRLRPQGWGRYARPLGDIAGSHTVRLDPSVAKLRVYNRYLRTSEAISNFLSEK